mgnify:CR=1 FL=1
MIFIAVILLWVCCFFSYLSTSKQRLINSSLPKYIVWIGFAIGVFLAVSIFAIHYGLVVALLITLLLVMAMWIMLVVISSHAKRRTLLVFSVGVGFFSSLFLLGVR